LAHDVLGAHKVVDCYMLRCKPADVMALSIKKLFKEQPGDPGFVLDLSMMPPGVFELVVQHFRRRNRANSKAEGQGISDAMIVRCMRLGIANRCLPKDVILPTELAPGTGGMHPPFT
jgi:hypothetical protein